MKLMTIKQYMKMSKPALIRKITKTLRVMPKAKLGRLCYNITKSKLLRLRVRKDRAFKQALTLKEYERRKALPRRKTKRKFSRKQLAAQRLFAKRARAGTLRKRRRR